MGEFSPRVITVLRWSLRQLGGGFHQDVGIEGRGDHLLSRVHQKYICIWNNSHNTCWTLAKQLKLSKSQKRSPHDQVGQKKKKRNLRQLGTLPITLIGKPGFLRNLLVLWANTLCLWIYFHGLPLHLTPYLIRYPTHIRGEYSLN